MSRQTVTAAVAGWLTAGETAFLSTVHPYPPKITSSGDFDVSGTSGGLVYVFIENQHDRRIAGGTTTPGGTAGRKWIEYHIVLLCLLRSVKAESESAGADNDAFLDGILARIRSNRQLGTSGTANPVFIAGEGGTDGGDDLTVESNVPRLRTAQLVEVFSSIRFTVAEIVQS